MTKTTEERIAHRIEVYGLSVEVAKAEVALEDSEAAVRAVTNLIEDEIRQAGAAIREKYRDQSTSASAAARAAKQVLDDIKIEEAHRDNRIGNRVVKTNTFYRNLWDKTPTVTKTFGIIEVRDQNTKFAGNVRYLPAMGSVFVRLIKQDGTPSLRFDTSMSGWEPVEV
jgi:hypothetical protein